MPHTDYRISKIAYSVFFDEKKRDLKPTVSVLEDCCWISNAERMWIIDLEELIDFMNALHKIESTTSFY